MIFLVVEISASIKQGFVGNTTSELSYFLVFLCNHTRGASESKIFKQRTMNTQSETHQELLIACAWWKHQVSLSTNPKISMETASRFESTLLHCLKEKVHNFWFPGQPNRGQAFRSIALERYSSPDRCLLQAAEAAGIQNILNCFPVHTESIIMWIDPV